VTLAVEVSSIVVTKKDESNCGRTQQARNMVKGSFFIDGVLHNTLLL
jgi:hypothetical protein